MFMKYLLYTRYAAMFQRHENGNFYFIFFSDSKTVRVTNKTNIYKYHGITNIDV